MYLAFVSALMKKAFVIQAEETENLISELARVTGGERALIEECGNMLSKTYTTQVCQPQSAYIISDSYEFYELLRDSANLCSFPLECNIV